MTENNDDGYAVLYVDDEEKALKYFSKALSGRYTVYTAADVDAAEEVLRAKGEQIAVLISDQRMPGKNGVELLKKVRAEYPAIVRLLTTAYSDLNDAIEAINRGEIFRYIQKPWIAESLQAEIVGAMDYFLLRRERDLLLAEKLTARQRMVGIERITQLVVFARTFDGLSNSDHALKNFLDYLHTLPGTRESDGLGQVDQWELTKWEAKRITDFIRGVTDDLLKGLSSPPGCDDSVTTSDLAAMNEQLAGEQAIRLSFEPTPAPLLASTAITVNRGLVEKLLRNAHGLLALLQASQAVTLNIAQDETSDEASGTTSLSFRVQAPRWPGDSHLLSGSSLTEVHPIYQRLLACMLVSAHHGGSCSLKLNDDYLMLSLKLANSTKPTSRSLPELGWEWLPETLGYYEPEIDEFYHDL